MKKYIPETHAHHLTTFKYTGGTSSITYQHIWSPFAQFLLKFVPLWVAPNVITLSALIILLVAHFLCMLPDQGPVASWKMIITSVSIFMYQQLDNMDGKQARRTKSSSPLGMLFDHGADSVVGYLIGLQAMKMLNLSYQFQIVGVPLFLMSQYFCAMWSQYFIGCFKLGRINPIDQGLPLYAAMFLYAGLIDLSIVDEYHWIGTYGQQFIYGLVLFLIPQLIYMSKDVFVKSNKPLKEVMFMTLLYFISAGAVLLTLKSIDNIDASTFYLFYYSIMFMWCRNMILIQVQFLTKQKYEVFNRGTISFLVLTGVYIQFHDYLPVTDTFYFGILCIIQGLMFAEFIYTVFNQGAQILGINIFSLKPRIKEQ